MLFRSAAAVVVASERVTIDASRVGIIIGPKGATMNAIQEKTGVKLDVNAPKLDDAPNGGGGGGNNQFRPVRNGNMKKQTATIIITGGTNNDSSRVIAKKAILELADRGYASLLMGDQFGESTISVHPRDLSKIVGPGGKIIKSIQSELNVKLTIPKSDWTSKTIQVTFTLRNYVTFAVCCCVEYFVVTLTLLLYVIRCVALNTILLFFIFAGPMSNRERK